MTFSEKQIDEIVRLLGTLAAAAASGAGIGFARPEQIMPAETAYLSATFVLLFFELLYLRRST